MEKSARRLSVINQSSSMERLSRFVDSLKSLTERLEISNNPKRDLESSMEHLESSVDHEASLVSSVGSPNRLIKSLEQVECQDRSGE